MDRLMKDNVFIGFLKLLAVIFLTLHFFFWAANSAFGQITGVQQVDFEIADTSGQLAVFNFAEWKPGQGQWQSSVNGYFLQAHRHPDGYFKYLDLDPYVRTDSVGSGADADSSYCMTFNGDSSYVNCGGDAAFRALKDLTVSFWFKSMDAAQDDCWIFDYYEGTQDGWGVYIPSSAAGYISIPDDIDDSGERHYKTAISSNTWYHLAVVMNNLENKMYLDGLLVGSDTSSTDFWNSFNGTVYIGARRSSSGFFNGQIANVAIHGDGLDSSQVVQLANGEILTNNLIAYWPLSEASGGTAYDASGNGHDGTLTGFLPPGPAVDSAWVNKRAGDPNHNRTWGYHASGAVKSPVDISRPVYAANGSYASNPAYKYNSTTLHRRMLTQAGAITAWIKVPVAAKDSFTIFSVGDASADTYLRARYISGKIRAELVSAGTSKWSAITDNEVIEDDTWYSITLNHNGQTPRIWVGSATEEPKIPPQTLTESDQGYWLGDMSGLDNALIGASRNNGEYKDKGEFWIALFEAWSRAMTSEEIHDRRPPLLTTGVK